MYSTRILLQVILIYCSMPAAISEEPEQFTEIINQDSNSKYLLENKNTKERLIARLFRSTDSQDVRSQRNPPGSVYCWYTFNISSFQKVKSYPSVQQISDTPSVDIWNLTLQFDSILRKMNTPFLQKRKQKKRVAALHRHLQLCSYGIFQRHLKRIRFLKCREMFHIEIEFLSSNVFQNISEAQKSAINYKNVSLVLPDLSRFIRDLEKLQTLYLLTNFRNGLQIEGCCFCCDTFKSSLILFSCSQYHYRNITNTMSASKVSGSISNNKGSISKLQKDSDGDAFKDLIHRRLREQYMTNTLRPPESTFNGMDQRLFQDIKEEDEGKILPKKDFNLHTDIIDIQQNIDTSSDEVLTDILRRSGRQKRQIGPKKEVRQSVLDDETMKSEQKLKATPYTRIHDRNLDVNKLKRLMKQLQKDRTKDPLWAMLSVVTLMVVMFWAVWACGMKRIDQTKFIHVDVEEDFHNVSVKDVIRSKRRFLPHGLFKNRHERKGYIPLKEVDKSDQMSDTSEDERVIYSMETNF